MLNIDQKGKEKYPLLFSPLKVRDVSIPNRIFFPPWDCNWATREGSVTEKLHDFYVSLAENGCGTIYTGAASVSKDSRRIEFAMAIFDKQNVESNRKLCKEIEARGAIPAIQLMNYGRQGVTLYTGKPVLAPSVVRCKMTNRYDPNYELKEMTLEDIERVKNDYVNSAILAVEAGYKIIQLHACHGSLMCGFLSPYTNIRTDQYGGSVENRCRFIVETVKAIREKLPNVVIDIRLSIEEFTEGGLVPGDYAEITPLIEKAGVDMMNASMSNFETAYDLFAGKLEPEARYSYLAETLKKGTSLPVGHAGFISSLEKGEELIKQGKMDLVGYGRMQFADNGFVRKSVFGEKIARCIWCAGCLADLFNPAIQCVYCKVNPKYKRPKELQNVK